MALQLLSSVASKYLRHSSSEWSCNCLLPSKWLPHMLHCCCCCCTCCKFLVKSSSLLLLLLQWKNYDYKCSNRKVSQHFGTHPSSIGIACCLIRGSSGCRCCCRCHLIATFVAALPISLSLKLGLSVKRSERLGSCSSFSPGSSGQVRQLQTASLRLLGAGSINWQQLHCSSARRTTIDTKLPAILFRYTSALIRLHASPLLLPTPSLTYHSS